MTKLLLKGDIIKVAASRGSGLLHQITTRDAGKACTSMEILGAGATLAEKIIFWLLSNKQCLCVPQQEMEGGGRRTLCLWDLR